MLSAKNVCVLTESRLRADSFFTPRFLIYFFLFCYNQEGALTSAHRHQEDQGALSLLWTWTEHDIIHKPTLIKHWINKLIDFTRIFHFLVFWGNFHGGAGGGIY